MLKKQTDIYSSLASVLNGNPTEYEKQQVESWMKEDGKNKKLFDRLTDTGYTAYIEKKR